MTERPARLTPAQAWADMRLGNARFVAGEPDHPRQDVERRNEIASAQRPSAALFGCSDSRLAAEIIFDEGLGDLFVVRNAGQVISDSVVGSLEYAVAMLGVPLIVVLGHDECGAVDAAIRSIADDAPALPPHIWRQIAPIVPAVRRVQRSGRADGEASSADTNALDPLLVGSEHLKDTVAELLHSSELISDAVAGGSLAIVGANYRLAEGTAVPSIVLGIPDDDA